jgi:hypothetical protein
MPQSNPPGGKENGEDEPADEVEQAEITEIDQSAPENNPRPTPGVEALATFSEQEGPFSFRILPVIERGNTDWRVVTYMEGTQGPVYQSREGVTDGAAGQFGISERLQTRINEALDYAKRELKVPEELGNQQRDKRTLHELEVMMAE